MEDKILIICVDRDNDIGEKLNVKGPIIGKKENLKIAEKLILKDPEESDANCLFGAIKEYNNLKEENIDVEIVTLLGDRNIGVTSDLKIEDQLKKIIKKLNPKKVIFVSDGAEDEYVLPIIQSKLDIISVKKIIVRQSSQLESSYYMLIKFFKEMVHDPQTSRILLGIPAIILVLYAFLGGLAWRFILGTIGIYLFVKAFHLENFVTTFINELNATFSKDKISFFLYILGGTFLIIGLVQGYSDYNLYLNSNFIISSLIFVQGGLIYYLISGIFILTARVLYTFENKNKNLRYLTYYALLFSIYIVLENSIKYITLPEYNIIYLILSVITSFLILLIALIAEKVAYT